MRGLGEHELLVFLLQFTLLLGAARLLGGLARRLGQPSVMGEVLAGVLLGPTVLGHLLPGVQAFVFPRDARQGGLLELLSWIGMVLLMMRTGIDTDVARWRTLKGPALLASLCGIALPFASGLAMGALAPAELVGRGGRTLFAVFMATAMSISAVKVIAKILLDLNLMRRDVGFVILGASILDDTIGWVILAIVIRVARTGRFGLESVATTLAATAGFALAAMLLVRPVASRAIRWLEREGRLEHGTTSAVVVLTLACGSLTQALGIHAIFGAFVAGLLVGELPRIKEATLESIDSMVMGVFAPVFFAYSGLKVEALALPAWPITLLVLGGAVVGKVVGAGVGARLGGLAAREALAVGIGLSARGSTELVVARIGMDLGVLAAPMYALIILVPLVTSLLTPVLLRLSLRGLPVGGQEARRLAEEAAEERAIIPRRGTKILVPTSGEPHAVQALRLAAPLARLPGATLVGLSVVTPPSGGRRRVGRGGRTEEEVVASSEAVARELDLPDFHPSVVRADSVDAAVTAEVARGYDLVVLGLDQPRALSHRLLRALLASGHSDVVVVRTGRSDGWFRRVLLPVTGSAPSRAAAELGFLYARETGAELHLLHVIEPASAPDRRALAELRLVGGRMLEELLERGRREDVRVRGRLVSSRYPARAILDAASEERADLVLVGATPRYVGVRAFFGPTTDLLLAHAPCAVAIYAGGVRPEALRATTGGPEPAERPGERSGAAPAPGGEGQATLH
ncbi:cation:proton antiporter domain-containing protein [Anaeromyxobacter paludicola]|uniref:Na+/H+ antiporter n=1 Tax=Anaeromyxobacter paludicola TaxID=2918171 RepID=A0ABM7XB90_9BACT|nr:cation:proton antiporter [Anaeromyxobacter paludicola]BDG09118.1 Na+/H+ antiporter [Anaeromyxobacter paludicola]